ncbi:MAG: hypothetical protein ACK559_23305, partial [bacterium]
MHAAGLTHGPLHGRGRPGVEDHGRAALPRCPPDAEHRALRRLLGGRDPALQARGRRCGGLQGR